MKYNTLSSFSIRCQSYNNTVISIFTILYLVLICVHSSSIIFGIRTANNSFCCSTTVSNVTLTLYWNSFEYQCDVNPIQNDTYYSCDTSNITITSQCVSDLNHSIQYGLQIDNNHHDTVGVDRIIIKKVEYGMVTNILYDIDYFCFDSSPMRRVLDEFHGYKDIEYCQQNGYKNGWNIIPVENDKTFPFDLIEFITWNQSKVHIMDNSVHCEICLNPINTPYYGGNGDETMSVINAISSWGIRSDHTVWIGNNNNISTMCDLFILHNDHVIGYRVIYKESIYGLTFITLNNKSYSCIHPSVISNISHYIDSGVIIYDGYYMNRIYSYFNNTFNAISFQFTPLIQSTLCKYQYILVESKESWYNANSICKQQYNSSLATIITDQDLQIANYLRNNMNIHSLSKKKVWIGLFKAIDAFNQTNWRWIDGTSCINIEHSLLNQSIEKQQQFGVLWNDDSVHTASDKEKFMFLCNMPNTITYSTCTPTSVPTSIPTKNPSSSPTINPTNTPSLTPILKPTFVPSFSPTTKPTKSPFTITSVVAPTIIPTSSPSSSEIIQITLYAGDTSSTSSKYTTASTQFANTQNRKQSDSLQAFDLIFWVQIVIIVMIVCIITVCFAIIWIMIKKKKKKKNA